jgi:hypothetical protein
MREMLTLPDLVPGFYRNIVAPRYAARIDAVHGHLDGAPVVDVAWLDRTAVGWRVASVDTWRVLHVFLWSYEPMAVPT